MRLTRVTIRRMPGVDRPFTVEGFDRGLSLVLGPNASGKTTLCRAIRHALWPRHEPIDSLDVTTSWREKGSSFFAETTPRGTRWSVEAAGGLPELPGDHLARCYTLGLIDLLDDEGQTDRELADRIRVQLSGGYDIAGVRSRLFPKPSRQHGRREKKALADARRKRRQLESRLVDLAREEDGLSEKRREQQAARRAVTELDLLRAARRLSELRSRRQALEDELLQLPPAAERVSGGEHERRQELERELEDARSRSETTRARIEEQRRVIASCGLGESPLQEAKLARWIERAREISEVERDLREEDLAVEALEAERDEAVRDLGGVDPARTSSLAADALDDLDRLARGALRLEQRRQALEERRGALEQPGPAAAEVAEGAIAAARGWLASPPAWHELASFRLAGVAGAIACLAGAILAGAGTTPAGTIVIAAGAGALAALVALAFGPLSGAARRAHRAQYEALDAPAPARWLSRDVRRLLAELEERHATARIERARSEELRRVEAELERLGDELQVSRRDGAATAEKLGIAPDVTGLGLAGIADGLRRWRTTEQKLAGQRARARTLARRFDAGLADLDAFLEHHVEQRPADLAAASAMLADLERRSRKLSAAIDARAAATADLDERERQIRTLEQRLEGLYGGLDLGPGDVDGLTRVVRQGARFRELADGMRSLEREIADVRRQLEDRPDLLEVGPSDLEGMFREAERAAGSLEDVSQEIGAIVSSVEEARKADDLERALAEELEARNALEDLRRESLLGRAGSLLLDDVEDEYETTARPAVLSRAAELFARFTGQRYELTVSSDGSTPRFTAIDHDSGRRLEVAQLSDATRVQLQLAARVAFATHAERGLGLPLLLDEALTNTDDRRFDAVAESLVELSQGEGRQVVYLTSDPADVARWREACERAGAAPPAVIDLAAARGREYAVNDPAQLRPSTPPEIPPPAEMSPAEYAVRLRVERLDPLAGSDAAHPFYAIPHDLLLLRRLLRAGVTTAGRWRAALTHGRIDTLLDERERAEASAWLDALGAFVDAARVGMGRPLAPGDLHDCPAISDTWVERIEDVVRDVDGDARRLLAAFGSGADERTRGFRSAKLEELEAWLVERGHLDSRDRLSRDAVRQRVLTACREHLEQGVIARERLLEHIEWLADVVDAAGREEPTPASGDGPRLPPPPATRPG